MKDLDKKSYGVLLEHLSGQYDKLIEIVSSIKKTVDSQPTREEFNELKVEVKTIKTVITITSQDIAKHENHIAQLETA